METLGLLPPGLGRTNYWPWPKARGDEALGSTAGGNSGRKDYSEAPLGPCKSSHAGANGVKVVGPTTRQPPVATLSHTDPNTGQQTWVDAAEVAKHYNMNTNQSSSLPFYNKDYLFSSF